MIESQKLSVYFIHVQIDRRFITAFTASAVPLSFTMRRACSEELKCINTTDRFFQNAEPVLVSNDNKDCRNLPNLINDPSINVNLSNLSDCTSLTVEDFQKNKSKYRFQYFSLQHKWASCKI